MNTARNQKITRTFWTGICQNRRCHLCKIASFHKFSNFAVEFGAAFQHFIHFWSAQIQKTIFQAEFFVRNILVRNRNRQRLRRVQNFEIFDNHFDITSGEIWVFHIFSALTNFTSCRNHEFVSAFFSQVEIRSFWRNHQL